MKGTFKPGDRLSIEKIPFGQIRKGDLIIFRKTLNDQAEFVVHRVKRITSKGLVTRGDNCHFNDKTKVTEHGIVGRVTGYDRNAKKFSAGNGLRGRLRAIRLHFQLHLRRLARLMLRKPYRALKRSGIVSRIWEPAISGILFQTPNGPLIKYINRDRVVANHWIEQNTWQCRRPYDLIVFKNSWFCG